jgi:hypothetical protein
MTAAGGLRNAALLLRELRMPDAAAAFCAACKEAGFHSAFAPVDAGGGPMHAAFSHCKPLCTSPDLTGMRVLRSYGARKFSNMSRCLIPTEEET